MSKRLQSCGRSHSAIVTSAPALRSADSSGGRSSSTARAATAVTNAMVGLLIRIHYHKPDIPDGGRFLQRRTFALIRVGRPDKDQTKMKTNTRKAKRQAKSAAFSKAKRVAPAAAIHIGSTPAT